MRRVTYIMRIMNCCSAITDNVSAIVPTVQSSYTIKFGDQSIDASVSGTTAAQKDVRALQVANGRFLTDGDNKADALVAVMGSQVATDLFGSASSVGNVISINGVKFSVVGVLESKGASFGSPDDMIFIPIQTGYDKLFGTTSTFNGKQTLNDIIISVKTTDAMNTVSAEATYLLRRSHNLKPADDADFNILNQTDILNTLNSVTQTLTIFLGANAGISLLVGGIGIMNIMLVSVTERTTRDRSAQGSWRDDAQSDTRAVPDRDRDTQSVGWDRRDSARGLDRDHFQDDRLDRLRHYPQFDLAGVFLCAGDRCVLWVISCLPRCESAPDGSTAI